MANASVHKKTAKKTQPSGDFSVIAAQGSSDSLLRNTSWPMSVDANATDSGPALRSEEFYDSGQISASHYALATAYDRVSKKLAEAEKRNLQLRQEASLRDQVPRMTESANYNLPSNFEDSVNQAWEAYNEKCKECQQLREELEDYKHRANNSEHFSRIQDLEEDVLRQKAKQDDVARKLEKTKMEADHLEKKEILAREELEKEREYQRDLIQIAERKHTEMEQRIDELERGLANEKCLTEELRRREKDHAQALEEDFLVKQDVFHSKIRDLEEINISLKEEVSVLISMQTGTSNMNGPISRPSVNGPVQGINSSVSDESDANITSLEHEIHSLQVEMNDLKKRANEQSVLLTRLCQDPKLSTLLETLQQTSPSKSENCAHQQQMLDTFETDRSTRSYDELVHVRKKTASPKMSKSLPNHDGREDIGCSSKTLSDSTSIQDEQSTQKQPVSKLSENGPSIMPTEEFIRSLTQDGLIKNNRTFRQSQHPENGQHSAVLGVSRMIHTPESNHLVNTTGSMKEGSGGHGTVRPAQPQYHSVGSAVINNANGEKESVSVGHKLESGQFHSCVTHSSNVDKVRLPPVPAARSSVIAADNSGTRNIQASNIETPSNRYIGSSSDEDNTSDDGFERLSADADGFHPKEYVVPQAIKPSDQASSRKTFQDVAYNSPSSPIHARPAIRARAESSVITPHSSSRPRSGSSGTVDHHQSDKRLFGDDQQMNKCPICGKEFTSEWTELRMSYHINAHFSDDEQHNNLMSFD